MIEPHRRALDLVGIPYRTQGRNAAVGLDCIGVILWAYDLQIDDVPTYSATDGSWDRIEQAIAPWFRRQERPRPSEDDLIIFKLDRSFHFGVVSGTHFVHADLAVGRVVSRRLPERLGRHCRLFRYHVG